MLGVGVGENPLYEIVSKLIAGNINEWDTWTVGATLADPVKILVKELISSDLETLFNNLGRVLVGAVLGGETKDVIDGATAICWGTVLANVLNTPVAELSMSNDIN